MDLRFDLVLQEDQLEKILARELAKEVQTVLKRLEGRLRDAAQEYVAEAIQASPEWTELSTKGSGSHVTLQEHLGLADPLPVLRGIVEAVKKGVVSETIPPQGNILGGILVQMLPGDYADVLKVDGAEYVSQGRFRRSRGGRKTFYPSESHPYTYVIPWLRWLLLEGAGIILAEAEINTARYRPTSRTGRAIMIHPTQRMSTGWAIPAQFAGTAEDNWLTRALRDYQVGDKIIALFKKLLVV